MEPRKATPLIKTPLNRLFFAINHYVSTGDHIGEGIGQDEGDSVRVMIPVNTYMEQDIQDFDSFVSRFKEIQALFGTKLEDFGRQGVFHLWSFVVKKEDMEEMSTVLREKPGKKGWGSMKKEIDKYDWIER